MDILYLFLSLLALWYFSVFLFYRIAWYKIPSATNQNDKDFVSVIVACRNEQDNIANIIQKVKLFVFQPSKNDCQQ